jgi:exonuclease SbcC
MRPHRLRISGFTCFRDEQDIDFRNLDLFAIAGPTGAGKTSILDAMVFALYGEVPRMGAQRLGELISLGLDRASAVLDFEVGASVYRVMRKIRRHGAAQTMIERLDGGAARALDEGVRGVEQVVKQLLGIDAATFLQAVVLPQGQFADFLKSKPAPRRAMLRSLLQLDVYERMRESASQLGRQAAQQTEVLRGRLDDGFRDATAERLAEIERRLGELAVEIRAASDAAELARLRLDALERAAQRHGELQRARARRDELEAERALIETDEQRVQRSERARPLVAIFEAATAARARHASARDEVDALAPRAAAAAAAYQAASRALQIAHDAASEIDRLRAVHIQLEQLRPLLPRRGDCQRRIADAEVRRGDAVKTLDAANRELTACADRAASIAAERDRLDLELQQTGHDPVRLQQLADALAPAADLVSRHRDLVRARSQRVGLESELAGATDQLGSARRAADQTIHAADQADARHAAARIALDAVRRAHAAHDLRSTVVPGEPCPVCLQQVSAVPSIDAPADLDAAKREELDATRAHTRCASEAQQARSALALAERTADDARRRGDRLADEIAAATRDIEVVLQRVTQLVGDLVEGDAGALGNAVPKLHAEARAHAERHAALERRRAELERVLDDVRHRGDLAQQQAQTAQRERDRAALDAEQAHAELATIEAQVRAVAASGEPEQERTRVIARIEKLQQARDAAVRAEQAARSDHETQSRALAIAEAARAAAAADLAAIEGRAAQELRDAGLATEQAVRAAMLSAVQRDEIERRARTWRSEHAVVTTRVAELEQAVGSEEIDVAALTAARGHAKAARDQHGGLLAEQGRLGGERRDVEARIARAALLREQLARATAARATYEQLAADLRTDQLQAHLLEGTFREIVQGASVRLLELSSGRYTLDYAHDDFFVIDHDNARERRRADTLSGGETFLTSLALALQLSEQIQRAAGAVRLDSLFIDEGFGTLDPETLATVSDAIQQLGRGHRMVGIITHVQDLTSALPARIDVVRGPDGSKVKVISEVDQ